VAARDARCLSCVLCSAQTCLGFLIRPHGVCACVCARARVCVHACSRGSLRSEVDTIQDVGERYERAATLSWRRVCVWMRLSSPDAS